MPQEQFKNYVNAVHRLTCRWNHTDGCGWFYNESERESWAKYYNKTILELQKEFTLEQLNKLADILRPETKDWT